MDHSNQAFWETRWQQGSVEEYGAYLAKFYRKSDPMIDLLKQYPVRRVCDAACGFGAYSLMLASNGFQVEGFDIAPTSVAVTKALLGKYGIDASRFKVASVLDTGYTETFDAVTARSVLDHMCISDAEAALQELFRIVRDGGILVVSFDGLDEEDLEIPHTVTEDGSILYTAGRRCGMIFHCYAESELKDWLSVYPILLSYTNDRGERFFAIRKL